MSAENPTDISLEEMLASCQADAQATADASLRDEWVPPPGHFTASIGFPKVPRRTWTNPEGQKVLIVNTQFTILEGPVGPDGQPTVGKVYEKALWSSSTIDADVTRKLAALLNEGKKTNNWAENIRTIFAKANAAVVEFDMEYKPNKNAGGEPYKNMKFKRLLSAGGAVS